MQLFRGIIICLLLATVRPNHQGPASVFAQSRDPGSILRSLENMQFDLDESLKVRGFTLRRETVSMTFDRGRMIFLRPVEGLVTGLFFWGEGTIVALPPNRIEKQQLNLFTGAPILNEHFDEAFIRFTDDTYAQLMEQVEADREYDETAPALALEKLQDVLRSSTLINYRIVSDLLDARRAPMFLAKILGRKLGTFDFSCDYRKTENINLGQFQRLGSGISYDNWSSFSSHEQRPESYYAAFSSLIDVRHYSVETVIDKNDRISGITEVEFVSQQAGQWVLAFDLSRFLKVSEVMDDQRRLLSFYQNGDMTNDEEVSKLGHDVIMVLLKEPLQLGQAGRLRFTYSGDVISRVGTGMFYVGSRGSWYPNTGNMDRARYRLKFAYPKAYTVVATGDLLREREQADQRHAQWVSEIEIPVAGFNYGDYVRKTTRAGELPIEVYANRGIENVYMEVMARAAMIREINRQREMATRRPPEVLPEPVFVTPNFSDFETTRFVEEIANQVASTVLFFESIMGKYPYNKLAISQIPGRFNQGWPSLLYVTSLTFLSPHQKTRLGLEGDAEALQLEFLHSHEVAHQWWGNQVGWKSYRDLWIMEGFSNYFGYLASSLKYPSGVPFRDLMRRAKDKLLAKVEGNRTIESIGPVWLGARLSSSKFPGGYAAIVYEKGAWILHMLRYLMADPVSGSDERFRSLIREFIATYEGKLASTEDFKQMVEKHMGRDLDLEGNRKMDWFFDQWVYGTGIPTYRLDYSLSPLKNGTFVLKGRVIQEKVSEYFMMPIDVFGRYGRENLVRLGRVVASGSETPFKFTLKAKPLRVTLDENNEILCENKTL